jgi:hypothetical protein
LFGGLKQALGVWRGPSRLSEVYYHLTISWSRGAAVNRTELQQLAEERVRDSDALLKAGQWSGAYYLAGYAVECGLKACIAKLTNLHDFPDKELAQRCYTHKIETLVEVAGLVLIQAKFPGFRANIL